MGWHMTLQHHPWCSNMPAKCFNCKIERRCYFKELQGWWSRNWFSTNKNLEHSNVAHATSCSASLGVIQVELLAFHHWPTHTCTIHMINAHVRKNFKPTYSLQNPITMPSYLSNHCIPMRPLLLSQLLLLDSISQRLSCTMPTTSWVDAYRPKIWARMWKSTSTNAKTYPFTHEHASDEWRGHKSTLQISSRVARPLCWLDSMTIFRWSIIKYNTTLELRSDTASKVLVLEISCFNLLLTIGYVVGGMQPYLQQA